MPRDPATILRDDRIRLTHMADSARRAVRIASGMTEMTLAEDEIRLLAIVKSIEVIGEASTKVSEATQKRLAAVDWHGIRQMRNRLIHGYDTIDPARVWDALSLDVPPLIRELEQALAHWPDAPTAIPWNNRSRSQQ
jgi:uncharacterized protein with HEPN domain